MNRVFEGRRTPDGAVLVTLEGRCLPLAPSLRLRPHSPTGFEWGYGGSGPSQLALALLLASGVEAREALALYQAFKTEVVSGLSNPTWRLTSAEVLEWAARQSGGAAERLVQGEARSPLE